MGICTLMLFSVNINGLCINIWKQVTQGNPMMSFLKLTYLACSWLQRKEKVVQWLSFVNGSCPVASSSFIELLPFVLHVLDAIFEAWKRSHYFLAQNLAVSCHNYSMNPGFLEPRLSLTLPCFSLLPFSSLWIVSRFGFRACALHVSLACRDTFLSYLPLSCDFLIRNDLKSESAQRSSTSRWHGFS